MNYLSQVTKGIEKVGQRFVISGVEKIGKTTLACQSPDSLLVPVYDERGYKMITTPRLKIPLQTWTEVEEFCKEVIAASRIGNGLKSGSSLVWDSATSLERVIHNETLSRCPDKVKLGRMHSMETAHGGYGKAYPIANALFAEFLSYQDQLAFYGGINIIITCHIFVARLINPTAGEYDSYELLLHSPKNNKTYGKREHLTQWADAIFLMREPMAISKDKDAKVSLGIDLNSGRVLEVDRAPAWTAGNRYGLTQSISIPKENGWNFLAEAIYKSSGIDLYNRAIMPQQQQ